MGKINEAGKKIGIFLLKCLGSFLIIYIIIFMIYSFVENMADNGRYSQQEYYLKTCDNYRSKGDYANLYQELTLYDLHDEAFDEYWELANGYLDYISWENWKNAANAEKEALWREQFLYDISHIRYAKNTEFFNGLEEAMSNTMEE